jgi:hypothetical protein
MVHEYQLDGNRLDIEAEQIKFEFYLSSWENKARQHAIRLLDYWMNMVDSTWPLEKKQNFGVFDNELNKMVAAMTAFKENKPEGVADWAPVVTAWWDKYKALNWQNSRDCTYFEFVFANWKKDVTSTSDQDAAAQAEAEKQAEDMDEHERLNELTKALNVKLGPLDIEASLSHIDVDEIKKREEQLLVDFNSELQKMRGNMKDALSKQKEQQTVTVEADTHTDKTKLVEKTAEETASEETASEETALVYKTRVLQKLVENARRLYHDVLAEYKKKGLAQLTFRTSRAQEFKNMMIKFENDLYTWERELNALGERTQHTCIKRKS